MSTPTNDPPESRLNHIAFSLRVYAEGLSQFEADLRRLAAQLRRPALTLLRRPGQFSTKEDSQ